MSIHSHSVICQSLSDDVVTSPARLFPHRTCPLTPLQNQNPLTQCQKIGMINYVHIKFGEDPFTADFQENGENIMYRDF